MRRTLWVLLAALLASSLPALGQKAAVRAPAPVSFASSLPERIEASAQASLSNPSTVEFAASADHALQDHGVDVVSRYDLEVFKLDGTTLVQTFSLGKPAPNASNLISISSLGALLSPVVAGDYVVKIAAVGPGGASLSGASNPFSLEPRSPAASGVPTIKLK